MQHPFPQRFLHLWRWFDPRGRKMGSWAFILNRITALGLTLYLFMHLGVLSLLVVGPQAYHSFISLAHQPLVIFGELLVVLGALIHGLNGMRVVLTSFGLGVRYQKLIFVILMLAAAGTGLYFAFRMLAAG